MTLTPLACAALFLTHLNGSFDDRAQQAARLSSGGPAQVRQALALLVNMEREARRLNDNDWLLYARWKQAACEFELGDFSRAEKSLETAIKQAPPDNGLLLFVHRDLGEWYLRSWRARQAEYHIQMALDYAARPVVIKGQRIVIEEPVLLRIQLLQAECLTLLGKNRAAQEELLHVESTIHTRMKEARRQGVPAAAWAFLPVECAIHLSELDRRDSHTVQAIERLQWCLSYLQEQKSPDVPLLAASGMGLLGSPARYRALLAIATLIPGRTTRGKSFQLQFTCHVLLAWNYWKLGRFGEADAQLDLAAAILPGIWNDRTEGDLEQARATLRIEEATAAIENAPGDPGAVGDRATLDRLEQAEKFAGSARAHYAAASSEPNIFTAIAIYSLAQVQELRARAHQLRGEAGKSLRKYYDEAQKQYDLAIPLLSSILPGTHDLLLQARRCRARLCLKRGDMPAASAEAIEAFRLFTGGDLPVLGASTAGMLASPCGHKPLLAVSALVPGRAAAGHGEDDVDCGLFHHLLLQIADRAGNAKEAGFHAESHRRLAARHLISYLAGLTAPEQVRFFRMWDDPGLHASLGLGVRYPSLRGPSAEWLINGKAKIAEVLAPHCSPRPTRGPVVWRDSP